MAYAGLSSELDGDDEILVEAYYASALNDHLSLGANLQHLVNPAGDGDADDILTLGLRASAGF